VVNVGDTVALHTSDGPCGVVAAINPATADEALIRFADPNRTPAWVSLDHLVIPDYNYGMVG
jgi:hypothetical protein